jgi:hypothetical protein
MNKARGIADLSPFPVLYHVSVALPFYPRKPLKAKQKTFTRRVFFS